MPRVSFSLNGGSPFQKLMGHVPPILQKWNDLSDHLSGNGQLSAELKEQVRRTLAFGNGCEYCMAKGKPARVQEDERTSLAVAFANIFLDHRDSIDDKIFATLRQSFSESEIVELCAFICFTTASQQFGAMMNLQP
ncbi:carboxymuconolactone decarboxylase family protein [Fictibacillus sp. Mic-4]|uniref:carboxymuconolactone decarboxylase family protein n=1 Tax=Fictibacillus TaxID=1329200 RepID=UPI0004005DBE|nr:carboxymuconolactone decarboxylase family protein [Fictibacillus gelatini]